MPNNNFFLLREMKKSTLLSQLYKINRGLSRKVAIRKLEKFKFGIADGISDSKQLFNLYESWLSIDEKMVNLKN